MEKVKKQRRVPSKRRSREESSERLLKAAVEVFSKVGYDASTTRMVAKKAGLNESLIHRYFESKSGLLIAVLNHFISCEKSEVALTPVAATVNDELNFFFEYTFEKHWRMRELMKVVVSRMIVDKKISDEMAKNLFRGGIPYLLPRLEKLQNEGKMRKDIDLPAIAFSLSAISFTVSFMAQVVLRRDRDELRKQLRETARVMAESLSS